MSSSANTNSQLKKANIAIICRLDTPGGVQSVAMTLIQSLNQAGIIPTLVWDTPPDQRLLTEKNIQVQYLHIPFLAPSPWLDRLPVSLRYFFRIANCVSDTDLPAHFDFFYIFYNGFLVSENTPHLRYLSGPPLLPQLEKVSPGLRGIPFRLFRWVYKNIIRHWRPVYEYHVKSNYVINSRYTASLFQEAHGETLPVVYPPVDLSNWSFSLDDLSERNAVLFFSRFVDYKRPEVVLQLARQYPQYSFILMGGVKPQLAAYFEGLKEWAKKNQLDNVTFIANPTDIQVRQIMKQSRFFVFPTMGEHFGMVTVEAIASGLIPLVHDSGGQREIVPDERLRFTDTDLLEKFELLIRLSDDQLNDIRSALEQHIQNYSANTFSQKMLAPLHLTIEEETLNEFQIATL